jgi:hypothetical protein
MWRTLDFISEVRGLGGCVSRKKLHFDQAFFFLNATRQGLLRPGTGVNGCPARAVRGACSGALGAAAPVGCCRSTAPKPRTKPLLPAPSGRLVWGGCRWPALAGKKARKLAFVPFDVRPSAFKGKTRADAPGFPVTVPWIAWIPEKPRETLSNPEKPPEPINGVPGMPTWTPPPFLEAFRVWAGFVSLSPPVPALARLAFQPVKLAFGGIAGRPLLLPLRSISRLGT